MPKIVPNLTAQLAQQGTTVVDHNVPLVRDAVLDAFNVFMSGEAAKQDMRDQTRNTGEQVLGARETVLLSLAEKSTEHEWTTPVIETAVDAAMAQWSQDRNDNSAKTVKQFSVECKRAMHPMCRDHVATDLAAAQEAFGMMAETIKAATNARKTDKSVKIPTHTLNTAFVRKYHAVVGSYGSLEQRIKNSLVTDENGDPDFFAMADERIFSVNTDPKLAKKALDRLATQLEQIKLFFPAQEMQNMIDYVDSVKPEQLSKARDRMLAKQREAQRQADREKALAQRMVTNPIGKPKPTTVVPPAIAAAAAAMANEPEETETDSLEAQLLEVPVAA